MRLTSHIQTTAYIYMYIKIRIINIDIHINCCDCLCVCMRVGQLTLEEFRRALPSTVLSDAEVATMFDNVDVNRDGN